MSKNQKVKFRIIPEKLMKDLVEFIDEMQFEATKVNTSESHHLINLCNYLISSLINSDGFTEEFGKDKDKETSSDDDKYWTSSSTDYFSFDMSDLSEEEYERLLKTFDSFMKGFQKETKKPTDKGNKKTLKEFEYDLIDDTDLTAEEKFELYYDEYRKRKNKSRSMDSVLKELGIKKYKKD